MYSMACLVAVVILFVVFAPALEAGKLPIEVFSITYA